MKIAVAGSKEYLSRGVQYLEAHGYPTTLLHDPIENTVGADLLICLAFPKILTKPQLSLFHKGCINYHIGLPRYQGRHPLNWMLIDGLQRIPASVHFMDEGIDTGDVLEEEWLRIDRDETYASAMAKILAAEGPMLLRAVRSIDQGTARPRKQVREHMRYTRKRTPEDSNFDFNRPSADIHRFINALSDPMPNATCNGVKYARSYSGRAPGEIVAHIDDGRVVVATADGVVLVDYA